MLEIKKDKCKNCSKIRILNKEGICIFCVAASRGAPGTEIKTNNRLNLHGKEIKSKTGHIDENIYLRS